MFQHHQKRNHVIAPWSASLQLLFDSVGMKFHTKFALCEFHSWNSRFQPRRIKTELRSTGYNRAVTCSNIKPLSSRTSQEIHHKTHFRLINHVLATIQLALVYIHATSEIVLNVMFRYFLGRQSQASVNMSAFRAAEVWNSIGCREWFFFSVTAAYVTRVDRDTVLVAYHRLTKGECFLLP